MRKIYLPLLGLVTLLPCQIYASDPMDCREAPKCTDYGYIHNGCPGNFVACPFDTNFKTCDEEAYQNDFKFALASGNVDGRTVVWDKANDSSYSPNYSGYFIVGAGSGYCGVANGSTGAQTTKEHSSLHITYSNPHTKLSTMNRYKANVLNGSFKGYHTYQTKPSNDSATTNTKSGSPNGQNSSALYIGENRPVNYAVDGYFYTYTPMKRNKDQVALSTTLQNCAFFGYTDEEADCPGDYVVCPFDNAKVMCDMQAQAGEIKFSLHVEKDIYGSTGPHDHAGWLYCDGRDINNIADGRYKDSELKKVLKDAGFDSKLPDYRGMFLRMKGGASSTSYASRQKPGIKEHTHIVRFSSGNVVGMDKVNHTKGTDQTYYIPTSTEAALELSVTNTTPTDSDSGLDNRPPNYAAYIYIYTGKL